MPFHHDYQFSKKVTGVGEEGRGGLWVGFHFQGPTFLETQLCTRKPAWPGSRGPKLSPDMASCLCVLWDPQCPKQGSALARGCQRCEWKELSPYSSDSDGDRKAAAKRLFPSTDRQGSTSPSTCPAAGCLLKGLQSAAAVNPPCLPGLGNTLSSSHGHVCVA